MIGAKADKTIGSAGNRAVEERLGVLLGERGKKSDAAVRHGQLGDLVADILNQIERDKAKVAPPDDAETQGTLDFHDPSLEAGAYGWGSATRWRPPGGRAGPALLMRRRSGSGFWLAAEASGGRGRNEPRAWFKGSSGAAEDFGNWREVYHQASILGTVGITTGGIPSGAVIETNALDASAPNGRYVRFADGHQICRLSVAFNAAISTAFMGGFRSAVQTWTFAKPFQIQPLVIAAASGLTAFGAVVETVDVTTAGAAVTAVTSQSAADRVLNLTAIGRWTEPLT